MSNGSCSIVSVVKSGQFLGRVGNSANKNNIILSRIHMKTSLLANKRGDERIILIAVLERDGCEVVNGLIWHMILSLILMKLSL